jgi:YD repeat-containing protein
MKKIKKTIAMMLLYPVVVCAQQISVHSPTAANLGLYGEIPVSYYTGTPNISIPLYEIQGKHITVPVGLTYHPAGIRPELHPGPVGLGWSLQAGGVISRTVRGNSPDESDRNNNAEKVEGYLNCADEWLKYSNWKDNAKNIVNNNCVLCENMVRNYAPIYDWEPDEFSFSVLNISGKFYFDHTGQIQVQCDKPVKVIFNNAFVHPMDSGIRLSISNSYPHRAFKSFTIVDEQGTQYHFGGVSAIEFSDPISYGKGSDGYGTPATGLFLQATSWFLNQIQSADGADIINFEYERGPFVSQLYHSFDTYSFQTSAGNGSWSYSNIPIDGTLISPVYLRRITKVNGEKIALDYSQSNDIKYSQSNYESLFSIANTNSYGLLYMTNAIPRFQPVAPTNKFDRIQWLKLDGISVKSTVNESIRQINFIYNNNPAERLFLDSINIYGTINGLFPPPMNYTFTYKNKNRLPTQYLTCITDHWGFNNGKTYPFSAQNKAPDANYADSGVLSEIRYPTGGVAQFEYELHDYAKIVHTKNRSVITNQSGTAGGLRIKKIITDNLTGNTVSREFFYKETPTSSLSGGILNMLPQYTYFISGIDCEGDQFNTSIIRSMPVIPLTKDNEGLYIGYTYVCEQISGGNGGYTQYHYTNHDNGHSDVLLANGAWKRSIFPSDPHCSRYFERGRLIKETSYNAGGQAVVVNETTWNRYGSQGEDNPRAFLFDGIRLGFDYCSSVAYLHYCYKFLPSRKTESIYDFNGQNPVITATDYDYNSKNLVKTTTVTNSDGIQQATRFVYPFELSYTDHPDMTVMNKMTEQHILSPVIEKVTYQKSNGKVIEGIYNKYEETETNSGIYKPARINILPLNGYNYGNLYPTNSGNISLYLEHGMHVNEIRGFSETFTINKDSAKINIDMELYQENRYLFDEVPTLCFVITITDNTRNKTVYRVEAMDSQYGVIKNNTGLSFVYNRADEIILPAGNYTLELTHKSRWTTEYGNNPSVGHLGTCNLTYVENAPSMYASYSLLTPEMYYKYGNNNIVEVKQAGSELTTVYLWGYNYQYPIAEIKNATKFQVTQILTNQLVSRVASANEPASADLTAIKNLRTNPNLSGAAVTVYEYKPLVGISRMTDPRGVVTEYIYDDFGRLKQVLINGKEEKEYQYHYKN